MTTNRQDAFRQLRAAQDALQRASAAEILGQPTQGWLHAALLASRRAYMLLSEDTGYQAVEDISGVPRG